MAQDREGTKRASLRGASVKLDRSGAVEVEVMVSEPALMFMNR